MFNFFLIVLFILLLIFLNPHLHINFLLTQLYHTLIFKLMINIPKTYFSVYA
jgi:hypothetical protein